MIVGEHGGIPIADYTAPKKKVNRPSWKTEYESVFKMKEKLRVQRNMAVTLTACYILVDLLFKAFS